MPLQHFGKLEADALKAADDLAKAKRVQTKLMTGLKDAPPTDPKLTHSAQKRDFPKRKQVGGISQPPKTE